LEDVEEVSYRNRCAVWQTSSAIRHRSVYMDRLQSNGASSETTACCGAHRWLLLVVDDSATFGGGTLHPSCRQPSVVERWRVRTIQCPVSVMPRPSSTTVPMSAAATFDDDASARLAPAAPGLIVLRCVAWRRRRRQYSSPPVRAAEEAGGAEAMPSVTAIHGTFPPLQAHPPCAIGTASGAGAGAAIGNREGTMSDGRFDTATPSRLALVVAVLLSSILLLRG
jgi:hypothetical protein